MPLSKVEIFEDGTALLLDWADATRARFHAVWLRDNALDAETRSPGNGQRLITVLDIPPATIVESARLTAGGDLRVAFAPEGKEVTFPAEWLKARRYARANGPEPGWTGPQTETWDGVRGRVTVASYREIRADRQALGRWLGGIRRYGFALMRNVPCESGKLCEVA